MFQKLVSTPPRAPVPSCPRPVQNFWFWTYAICPDRLESLFSDLFGALDHHKVQIIHAYFRDLAIPFVKAVRKLTRYLGPPPQTIGEINAFKDRPRLNLPDQYQPLFSDVALDIRHYSILHRTLINLKTNSLVPIDTKRLEWAKLQTAHIMVSYGYLLKLDDFAFNLPTKTLKPLLYSFQHTVYWSLIEYFYCAEPRQSVTLRIPSTRCDNLSLTPWSLITIGLDGDPEITNQLYHPAPQPSSASPIRNQPPITPPDLTGQESVVTSF